jgi:SagB-type dehydrogenase family enzyme
MMSAQANPSISRQAGRYYLTDRIRLEVDWSATPQARGERPPAVQKPAPPGAERIALPPRESWHIPPFDLATAIADRQSRRGFRAAPLTLEEIAFLLWSTQGVRAAPHPAAVLRTVPSAGCRHPFETYLAVLQVTGLEPGLYRYLPLDHALLREGTISELADALVLGTHGQHFAGEAAAVFLWTALPARTEWRYAEASYKVIALDAGHVCQNLYLACAAIGAGTCAIAAYDQGRLDALLGVDGEEEFTIYLAPVGKL